MEIKEVLNKPYTEQQRIDFVTMANINNYRIKETEVALEAWGYTEEELAKQREIGFKSTFFLIPGYGWFRRVPKGYQSAVECLTFAFNNVSIIGKLPANTLIFYMEPDYTQPYQCTEEWLVAHQIFNEEMTAKEFGQFFALFSVAWNNAEHVG